MARLSLLLTLVPAALVACGGSKPPDPIAPAAQPTVAAAPPPAASSDQATGGNSGNVAISDEIRRACGISDADAYFAFDSTRVRSQDLQVLDKVAVCFTSGPLKGRAIRLVGRADPRGPTEYNMLLGHQRADTIGGYLMQHGMEKSKTESTSRGSMDASGSDEPSWAKDRRVDVLLGN